MPPEQNPEVGTGASNAVRGSLAKLTRLMAPPAGGGDVIDWSILETQGIRLPADYREFVAIYGEGDIDDNVGIATPGCLDVLVREQGSAGAAADRAAYLRSVHLGASLERWRPWQRVYKDDAGQTGTVRVIEFGSGLDGEVMFWECCSDDPDEWTLIMFKRQHGPRESGWRRYGCGMVDFVAAVLDGSVSNAFSAANFPASPPVFTQSSSRPT